MHGFHPSEGFDRGAKVIDDFLGDGGCGDTADCFAGRGTSASLPVTNAEFGIVGIVGVGWPVFLGHFGIGLRTVVLVANKDGDRRSEGEPFEGAGKDFGLICLIARGGDLGLAGAATVEIDLKIGFGERDSRGASVNHDADASTVGFTESRNTEKLAKLAGHGPDSSRGLVGGKGGELGGGNLKAFAEAGVGFAVVKKA